MVLLIGLVAAIGWHKVEERVFAFRITPGDGVNPPVLEDLGHGGFYARAGGVNDAGEVAGHSSTGIDGRAFRYSDQDGLIDLGTLGGRRSDGLAINELGEVTGQSVTDDPYIRPAFRHSPGQSMQDLGDLSRKNDLKSKGIAINDHGDVVGVSDIGNFTYHPFLYTDQDGMVDLGSLGGRKWWEYGTAVGINNQQVIIGDSMNLDNISDAPFPFLWADGTMYYLQDLVVNLPAGCRLQGVEAINEFNEICGMAIFADGTSAGFVLTPVVEE